MTCTASVRCRRQIFDFTSVLRAVAVFVFLLVTAVAALGCCFCDFSRFRKSESLWASVCRRRVIVKIIYLSLHGTVNFRLVTVRFNICRRIFRIWSWLYAWRKISVSAALRFCRLGARLKHLCELSEENRTAFQVVWWWSVSTGSGGNACVLTRGVSAMIPGTRRLLGCHTWRRRSIVPVFHKYQTNWLRSFPR